ncbi:MAG: hypothetical protein ACRDJM_11090, partial [Actinomycetota bacterium]
QVRDASGAWEPLRRGRALAPGEEVRTEDDGTVVLSSGSGSFEMARGAWLIVRSAQHVVARTGKILASAQRSVRLDDESGLSAVAKEGSFRLDVGTRVAVYRGSVSVSLPAGAVEVPVGREVTLGLVAPDVRAIAIDPNDPWDVRLLADAIQIDRALRPYQRTFDASTASDQKSLDFFGRYVEAGAIGFLGPLLPARLARYGKFDVLVALFIGIERSGALGTPLTATFAEVIALRDEGASFGLAAQVLGVKPQPLLQRVVTGLTPGAPPQRVEPTRRPGQPTPSPQPTGSRSPSSSPSPSPTGTGEPSPSPSPTQSSPTPTSSPTCIEILGLCP